MAGTVTQTRSNTRNGNLRVWTITLAWTAATNGTLSSTDISSEHMEKIQGLYLFRIRTIPGATQPTANYDIVINDADGVDVTGGVLANRSATATETVTPMSDTNANLYGPVYCGTQLTMVLSNNSVNSATGTVRLYFSE